MRLNKFSSAVVVGVWVGGGGGGGGGLGSQLSNDLQWERKLKTLMVLVWICLHKSCVLDYRKTTHTFMGTQKSLSMCILFPSDSGSGFGCQGHNV